MLTKNMCYQPVIVLSNPVILSLDSLKSIGKRKITVRHQIE